MNWLNFFTVVLVDEFIKHLRYFQYAQNVVKETVDLKTVKDSEVSCVCIVHVMLVLTLDDRLSK